MAIVEREQSLVNCAALAAYSTEGAFRISELSFYLELFSNWIAVCFEEGQLSIQTTQLQRYLNSLAESGHVRKSRKAGKPHYKLTRSGILELLSSAVMQNYCSRREHFFFVFYFLNNYRDRLAALADRAEDSFSSGLKVEYEELLSSGAFLEREIQNAETELKKVTRVTESTLAVHTMVQNLLGEGLPMEEIARQVEQRYPYEFHSKRPLSELLARLPKEQSRWELVEGHRIRAAQVYQPTALMLRQYLDMLQALSRELC